MNSGTNAAVIVLNWNNSEDTIQCLHSLAEESEVVTPIVVDNGSTDRSVAEIQAAFPKVRICETGENLGYAGGNNFGIRLAIDLGYEVISVLNNDTMATPGLWSCLLSRLETHNDAFVALSPRIMYADSPSEVWFSGGVWDRGWPRHLQPGELSEDSGSFVPSPLLSGCCIVARAETWRRVGLFDETFFLIFEDSDWSARAVKQGGHLEIVSDALLLHKVSRTFAGSGLSSISGYYYARNGLWCVFRHQRRYLLSFAYRRVIRQALSDFRRGELVAGLSLLAGIVGCVLRHTGMVPRWLRWLASRP